MHELVDLVALEENGPDGPPKELTWRQIETLGHGRAGVLRGTTVPGVSSLGSR